MGLTIRGDRAEASELRTLWHFLGSRPNSTTLPFQFVPSSSSVSLLTFCEHDPPSNLPLYLNRDQSSLRGTPAITHARPLLVTPSPEIAAISEESYGTEPRLWQAVSFQD